MAIDSFRVVIYGTGGAAGFFGGRLAKGGCEVTFIARGEHLKAIQSNGLSIKSPTGNFIVIAEATNDPSSIKPADLIILGTKADQVVGVAPKLKSLLKKDSIILPLQNGIETVADLCDSLGKQNVVGGTCRIISKIASPGVIEHSGVEPNLTFGELDNKETPRIKKLAEVFEYAGISASVAEDIHTDIWHKFILMASWSGMGAVTRMPVGKIREIAETRSLLTRSIAEVASLGRTYGIKLDSATEEKVLNFIDKLPEHGTSSMQRDIMAGRPSELEAHNGAVVRLAKKLNFPVPVNEFIYAALLPAERAARTKHS